MLSIDHFKLTQPTRSAPTIKLLESIQEEAARMKHIAQGLLLLMRHDSQAHPIDTHVLLPAVVERARKHMQPIAQSKHQSIVIEPVAQDITVLGNEEELLQVVLILLDNAIKYSPAHAITTMSLKLTAQAVRLTVTDQGIGVAPQDMQAIFKRFNRGSSVGSTQTKPAGLGLGLAIAHEIIVRHRGTIRIKRLQQGSMFVVSLPRLRSS
jgi:signal transduction histidine kinase